MQSTQRFRILPTKASEGRLRRLGYVLCRLWQSPDTGFSLVELLIGSIVLSIAMSAVVGVLKVSQSLHSNTQQGLDLEQNVSSALNFICSELVNAGSGVPYLTQVNGSPKVLVPSGALVGPLGAAVNSGYIYFVTPAYHTGSTVSKDGEGNTYVFVVSPDKKKVKKQDVVLGTCHDSGVEVIKGLSPNQIIVTVGKEKLSNNSLISL